MSAKGAKRLLTFRLDQEQRQRLKARLARDGRTMSEVVTNGLRQYVAAVLAPGGRPAPSPPDRGDPSPRTLFGGGDPTEPSSHGGALRPPVPPHLVLPDRIAAGLRELRSSGRSELLSATLAALREAGWPLRPLADALGVSRQAVQARVGRRVPAELRRHVTNCEPPPPFPHRRVASANGLRPHLTVKIDSTLRAAAHRAAAHEGSSLSQVVETILDRYMRHGMPDGDQPSRPPGPAPRPARRSR